VRGFKTMFILSHKLPSLLRSWFRGRTEGVILMDMRFLALSDIDCLLVV
jgi:hypothetical protein